MYPQTIVLTFPALMDVKKVDLKCYNGNYLKYKYDFSK